MSNLWSCSRKYSVMKQTELPNKTPHLRRKRTIYRASDCVLMGTSLHGHYDAKCCYYSTSPSPPLHRGSGLWGGISSFKPGSLCGSNLDNVPPLGGPCQCRWLSGIWCRVWQCYSSVHGLWYWCIGSMESWIWSRGLGHGTRKGKQDCWCFKFPEESAILQGNSTRSINSDMVLVFGEGLNDLTCCVPLVGCYCMDIMVASVVVILQLLCYYLWTVIYQLEGMFFLWNRPYIGVKDYSP